MLISNGGITERDPQGEVSLLCLLGFIEYELYPPPGLEYSPLLLHSPGLKKCYLRAYTVMVVVQTIWDRAAFSVR